MVVLANKCNFPQQSATPSFIFGIMLTEIEQVEMVTPGQKRKQISGAR
jgi:hypothetical protein